MHERLIGELQALREERLKADAALKSREDELRETLARHRDELERIKKQHDAELTNCVHYKLLYAQTMADLEVRDCHV